MASGVTVARRGFATKEGLTKLSNGLSVLSVPESRGPGLLRISICGGSRYEKYENLGSSHALRAGAGLSTGSHTYFGITRNMQQSGGALDVAQGREILSFSLTAHKKELSALADMLVDSVSQPAFKHWEVSDVCPVRIKSDIFNQSPASKAQELLYKAAFRTGLGNSIYAPSHMIGNHSAVMLKDFHAKTFSSERSLLIGMGMPTESLLQIAERLELPSSSPSTVKPSAFLAGEECRAETNGSQAHVALGFPGPSLSSSEKERLAALLYQRILGVGSRVKRGDGLGKLDKLSGQNVSAASIGGFHTDAGLFGAYLACFDHSLAEKSLRALIDVFRNPKVTEAEVKAAKKIVLADLAEVYNSTAGFCNLLEESVLLGGGHPDFKALEAAVNAVTIGDVQAVAKKISTSPLSMGAVGNLECLPYLDEL